MQKEYMQYLRAIQEALANYPSELTEDELLLTLEDIGTERRAVTGTIFLEEDVIAEQTNSALLQVFFPLVQAETNDLPNLQMRLAEISAMAGCGHFILHEDMTALTYTMPVPPLDTKQAVVALFRLGMELETFLDYLCIIAHDPLLYTPDEYLKLRKAAQQLSEENPELLDALRYNSD